MAPLHIILLGTCDTKLAELLYLRSQILAQSSDSFKRVTLIDVGRTPVNDPSITVSQARVVEIYHDASPDAKRLDFSDAPRGDVMSYMATAATVVLKRMLQEDPDKESFHGIIAAGGSGNTALAAQVMRDACSIGFPKLLVSTIASGDTSTIVGESDITLTYSVVDIAGLNSILKSILNNAAGAIVGMASAHRDSLPAQDSAGETNEGSSTRRKTRLGITMFGVTTPCVDQMRKMLDEAYPGVEAYVFHATGHGGRAMESLVKAGQIDAVLDLTTTEIGDHLVGGNMSAGGDRLNAALDRAIPTLISLGACDMVNFGPMGTVPERFNNGKRKLFVHNSQVTLMRTDAEENQAIGEFIVEKILKRAKDRAKIAVWIPRGGVSALSVRGQAFEDRQPDEKLFTTITEGLKGSGVKVIESHLDINDETTAKELVWTMMGLMSE